MSGERFNVLYVDDDIPLLDIARSFFGRDPEMKMRIASSASLALKMLLFDDYDVVISGFQIPGTDGTEFLRSLRSRGNNIPFILFTGRGREEVAIEALNSGADFCLKKGGDLEAQFAELRNVVLKLARNGRIERSLNKSKERFRRLVEVSPVAICISRGLEFIYVNPSYISLFGFKSEKELFEHPLKERVAPQYRGLMIEGMSRVARDLPIERSIESVGVRADGSSFHFLMTAAKIELDDGPAIVAYIIDISKNREFEEKLIIKEMQARLQSDMVDIVSWEFDGVTGHFIFDDLFFRLYGTSSDKEGGYMFTAEDYIQRFVHPEDAESVARLMQTGCKDLRMGGYTEMEHRIIRRDGKVRWVQVRVGALLDPDGKATKIYGVNQDISDRKMKEAMSIGEKDLLLAVLFLH